MTWLKFSGLSSTALLLLAKAAIISLFVSPLSERNLRFASSGWPFTLWDDRKAVAAAIWTLDGVIIKGKTTSYYMKICHHLYKCSWISYNLFRIRPGQRPGDQLVLLMILWYKKLFRWRMCSLCHLKTIDQQWKMNSNAQNIKSKYWIVQSYNKSSFVFVPFLFPDCHFNSICLFYPLLFQSFSHFLLFPSFFAHCLFSFVSFSF